VELESRFEVYAENSTFWRSKCEAKVALQMARTQIYPAGDDLPRWIWPIPESSGNLGPSPDKGLGCKISGLSQELMQGLRLP